MNWPTWAAVGGVAATPFAAVTAWVLGGRNTNRAAVAKSDADTADKIVDAAGGVVQLMQDRLDDVVARLDRAEQEIAAARQEIDQARRQSEDLHQQNTLLLFGVHQRDALIAQLREVIDAWTAWARKYQPWAEMATTAMRSSMINAPWPPELPSIPPVPVLDPVEAVEWAAHPPHHPEPHHSKDEG